MQKKEIIITPPKAFTRLDLRELWRYRDLVKSMVRRGIKTEFDRQYLALVWPVFRPLLMVFLFSAFRNLSEARTGVVIPYPLYVYGGLALWFFFVEATLQVANSVKQNAGLIQKVYFPRIISPISVILTNFVSFSITIIPLTVMMAWYGVFPGWHVFMLPVVLLQVAMLVLGIGCMFAALGLANNDWDRILGFLLYAGLFISPVIYAPSMLPESAQKLYSLNPMVGILMAFRATVFDGMPWPQEAWVFSSLVIVVIFLSGLYMFQRAEKHIVDRL